LMFMRASFQDWTLDHSRLTMFAFPSSVVYRPWS
jgi:hypothetical protein